MVRIDRVITRGGDQGETSLGDGTRLSKAAPRIELLGALDEANAALGILALHLPGETLARIRQIQNDLFDLGADLCRPGTEGRRFSGAALTRYEQETAAMNEALPPLTSFILPGGTPAAAQCHAARGMVRRAERQAWALNQSEPLNPVALATLNRLSDYLFVLARVLNGNGARDVLWVPQREE